MDAGDALLVVLVSVGGWYWLKPTTCVNGPPSTGHGNKRGTIVTAARGCAPGRVRVGVVAVRYVAVVVIYLGPICYIC